MRVRARVMIDDRRGDRRIDKSHGGNAISVIRTLTAMKFSVFRRVFRGIKQVFRRACLN